MVEIIHPIIHPIIVVMVMVVFFISVHSMLGCKTVIYKITDQLLALLQQPGRLLSICQKVSQGLDTSCS